MNKALMMVADRSIAKIFNTDQQLQTLTPLRNHLSTDCFRQIA
jgi:hypothetical protein